MNRVRIAVQTFQREADKGFWYASGWFWRRFYYRYCHSWLKPPPTDIQSTSDLPLSVVVPAAEKDAGPLKLCLAASNQMIRHTAGAKWVVGPESAELCAIARQAGWQFVPEDEVLPRPAAELKCRGWVLQQLIKFNAADHVPTENYLALDADTVFLQPQTFLHPDEKTVLRYSDQYELLYNRSLELVFGHSRRFPVSFVTHHMVFNRKAVMEMLGQIERRFGKSWWRVFLEELDRGHLISFSEFELYGNFLVSQSRWKQQVILEHWRGADRYAEDLGTFPDWRNRTGRRFNSVSFHQHTQ